MTVALLCAAQRQKALGTRLRTPEDTHTDNQTGQKVIEILSHNCVPTQRSADRVQWSRDAALFAISCVQHLLTLLRAEMQCLRMQSACLGSRVDQVDC